MKFENDPIADKAASEMKALAKHGVAIEGGHDYNRIFEAFYRLHQPAPSPQTAGAVWVEASDRLPERTDEVHWRFGNTKQSISPINIKFVFDNNLRNLWSEYQWLDESSGEEYSDEILKEWAAKADFVIAKDKEIQKLQESLLDVATKSMQEIESLKSLVEEAVDILDDVFHEPELALEIGRKIRSFKIANNL